MARPPSDREIRYINIKLGLDVEYHADLLEWFDGLPERGRATAVITRLRTGTVMETAVNGQVGEDEAIAALFGMMQ
jgi:hypothetical protein